jgi:hypothetical protein
MTAGRGSGRSRLSRAAARGTRTPVECRDDGEGEMGVVQVEPVALINDGAADDLRRLVERTRDTRDRLATAVRQSVALTAAAAERCEEARARCLASRPHRLYARLAGEIGSEPVQAVIRTDGTIMADPSLKHRADLLVRLGEVFDEGRLAATASGSPLLSALTLIRACDRVAEFEVTIS